MVHRGSSRIDFIGGIRRGFIKKLWLDSVVEFPNRRRIKNIETNEETVVDVTREVGTVSQSGNQWSALEMNELEDRISSAFADVVTYDGEDELSPDDIDKIDADYLDGYDASHYATKEDIASLNADLNDLKKYSKGDSIDISSYTSETFRIPNDGYIRIFSPYGTNSYNYVSINGLNVNNVANQYGNMSQLIFVKKNMTFKQVAKSDASESIYFPLI